MERHRHRVRLSVGPLVWLAVALAPACGPPAEDVSGTPIPMVTAETTPEEALRLSFARQVESVPTVRAIDYAQDGLHFRGPDGSGGEALWRVVIDEVEIETQPDGSPYRGNVTSRWFRNGEEVAALPNAPTLPEPYLEWGLSQVCNAYWDVVDQRWSWV